MLKAIKKKAIHFLLGLLCAGLILVVQNHRIPLFSSTIDTINGIVYDYMIKLNFHRIEENKQVVVVDIDDASIESIGRWPWPRDKFIVLLDNLKKAGAVVVVFDIVLAESEVNYATGLKNKILTLPADKKSVFLSLIPLLDKLTPDIDNNQAFAKVLPDNDVVLGFLFHDDETTQKGGLPNPLRDENKQFLNPKPLMLPEFRGYNGDLELFNNAAPNGGFVSNIPDQDGVIRHGQLLATHKNIVYGSLSLQAVMHFLLADHVSLLTKQQLGETVVTGLDVGGIKIPVNTTGQILIPFWGLANTIDTYSAKDIINNKIPSAELAGKVVILGSSLVLLSDLHESPAGLNFPGVEMVANMVQGMLSKQILTEHNWSSRQGLLELGITGLVYATVLPFLGPAALIISLIVSLIVILTGGFFLLSFYHLYIPLAILILLIGLQTASNFLYSFILERRQKNNIKDLFGQYVPTSYVKQIIDNPGSFSMDGEARDMTIFFADIRGFTTLSETLDAAEVKRLLNEFFSPITNIIFNHQGTIDKYVGDMIMAFWGAPLIDAEHSKHAIEAVIDIHSHLQQINDTLVTINLPRVSIGMGLNTGVVNVGDMGSSFRRSYTVIGDAVNLASRLQDLTKFYHVDILVSDTTRANQDSILWCTVDKVAVKGRSKPVKIYTIISQMEGAAPELVAEMHDYEHALDAYFKQQWNEAKTMFQNLEQRNQDNFLYKLYLQRIDIFSTNPPPADWDGTFIHHSK